MTDDEKRKLAKLRAVASGHLAEIQGLLHREVKLTLLMRRPGYPDGDIVITGEDDLAEAVTALERASREGKLSPPQSVHDAVLDALGLR